MGSDQITLKNVKVIRVDAENNVLLVRGSIPGGSGGYLVIRKAGR